MPVEVTSAVETADLLLLPGNKTIVRWSPDSIVPPNLQEIFGIASNYTVDISLYQLNLVLENYTLISKLATDIPNTGVYEITAPSINQSEEVIAGVIGISISEQFNSRDRSTRNAALVIRVIQIAFSPVIQFAVSLFLREKCSEWLSSEPSDIGKIISSTLPACPQNREKALEDTNFKEENFLLSVYHKGASSCFRQRTNFRRFVVHSYVLWKFTVCFSE